MQVSFLRGTIEVRNHRFAWVFTAIAVCLFPSMAFAQTQINGAGSGNWSGFDKGDAAPISGATGASYSTAGGTNGSLYYATAYNNFGAAVSGVEPRLIEVARALRLSPWARIVKIVAPASLPRIFVAFRLAAGISLIVAVTVEIAVNPIGLGYGVMTAGQALRPELMLAYLFWIGLVGYGLNAVLVLAQGRLFGRAARLEAPR